MPIWCTVHAVGPHMSQKAPAVAQCISMAAELWHTGRFRRGLNLLKIFFLQEYRFPAVLAAHANR